MPDVAGQGEADVVLAPCGSESVRARALVQNLGWITLAGMAIGYATMRGGQGSGESRRGKSGDPSGAARGGGATAGKPTDIPASGWLGIAKRTYAEIGSDRVLAVAAGVTFYALLALFPAITALVSLYGLVADPGTIVEHLAAIERFLPAGAADILRDQITRIAQGGETKLSLAFGISVALALWSANAGVKAIFDALNVAYGETEKRGFIKLNLTSLAFTLAIILFLLLAIGATAIVPILLDWLPLGRAMEWLIAIGRWPLLVVILMLGLAVLYRFGPSRDEAKWAWVSPARWSPASAGSRARCSSPGTSRISRITTRPTGHSAPSSACSPGCGSPPRSCSSAPSSIPRRSGRPCATRRRAHRSRSASAARMRRTASGCDRCQRNPD